MSRRLLSLAAAAIAALPAACVRPPSDSNVALAANFTALGTEPFWAAKVDGSLLLYQTSEDQAGKRVAVSRRDSGAGVEFSGSLQGTPLTLMIGAGPCSDGMSDTVYSHSAELRIGAQELKGCAKPR